MFFRVFFRVARLRVIRIVALLVVVMASVFVTSSAALAQGFDDQFSSTTLDPAWTVTPGARYYYTYLGLPVNDYSLTANPGHLRYSLNAMSHQYGFLNGYQAAPPPQLNDYYGYDPGLEISRPITGEDWLLEAKVTYYLPCTNGRELNLFVYFGSGGTGTTAAGWGRSRDSDCSTWGQNSLFARVVTQPGTTAGDLQYESAAEGLPLGDPVFSTYYLRLERAGGLLTWSRSTDNVNWTQLFSKDFGTALDGLDQRVTIVGHSWWNSAGSYADWDYVTVTPVDVAAPEITIATPADGASYTLGSTVLADYSCADEIGGSGLASCVGTAADGAAIDTATVGPKSFTVDAEDNAGNQSSLAHNYSVVYDFGGFYSPVDNVPTHNLVKAGQGVPVKFSLGGDQGLNVFAAGYPKSEWIACDSSTPLDGIEETVTAGSSSLSYDTLTDTYTYVWKTEKAWANTCRQLVVKLTDGTFHRANFKFTK